VAQRALSAASIAAAVAKYRASHEAAAKFRTEEQALSNKHLFSKELQRKFIATCTNAKGSKSRCECVLLKFEVANIEKGRSIAEMLILELGLRKESLENAMRPNARPGGFPLAPPVKGHLAECRLA
jgi:hypothetical protein